MEHRLSMVGFPRTVNIRWRPFWRDPGRNSELLETDRCVHKIAQNKSRDARIAVEEMGRGLVQ